MWSFAIRYIRSQLLLETAIGEIAHGRSIRQDCQLRTEPPREAAVYVHDSAKPHTGLARGGEREMILVVHRLNGMIGQHQSGIAARTRSGVMG